jgi:hypothetical protein
MVKPVSSRDIQHEDARVAACHRQTSPLTEHRSTMKPAQLQIFPDHPSFQDQFSLTLRPIDRFIIVDLIIQTSH